MERNIITINGKSLHLVLGKTEQDWENECGDDNCWSIQLEEFINGAMEVNEDIWYWLIDGRCYETNEEV